MPTAWDYASALAGGDALGNLCPHGVRSRLAEINTVATTELHGARDIVEIPRADGRVLMVSFEGRLGIMTAALLGPGDEMRVSTANQLMTPDAIAGTCAWIVEALDGVAGDDPAGQDEGQG